MTARGAGEAVSSRAGAAPVLIVFARQPVAGRVKTRLCPPLTPAQAADFYAAMLADVLAESRAFAAQHGAALWLAVEPPEAVGAFRRLLGARASEAASARPQPEARADAAMAQDASIANVAAARDAVAPDAGVPADALASDVVALRSLAGVRVVAQRGVGLGERMEWAAAEAFAAGFAPVLLRSSDSPGLGAETLASALRVLAAADLALCPDQSGGYVLAGLSRAATGLFAHRMSTPTVLDETLARARARGLSHALLPVDFDVDVAQDAARVAALSRTGARSRAWLASHAQKFWQRD